MFDFIIFYSDDMEEGISVTNVTDSNDGRNRRKVVFRSDDMKFSDLDESDTQDDDDDDDNNDLSDNGDINPENVESNDSDSEWSDFEKETEDKKDETDKSRFYGKSFGKENEIRKKIANELAKLDKINQESNISFYDNQEQDYSDGSVEFDEDSDIEDDDSEGDSEDDSEDENFKDNESDENDDFNNTENINLKDKKTSLDNKDSTNEIQEINEDTTLNWKKNLAQKAANAYYERQNSVANLWKLVYGKLFL